MAFELSKTWWAVLVLLKLVSELRYCACGNPQVPCLFIFGDSLSENGNNNHLVTLTKANYFPYGIDFPNGTTGRFCNGRTTVDIIGELLGFNNFIPSFATIEDSDMQIGANYASGAAGIRNETGKELGDNISFQKQVKNHEITFSRLAQLLNSTDSTKNYLNKCLYYVAIGSNDYLNNYFLPQIFPTSRLYSPDQYSIVLIEQYSEQLKVLYSLGARKFALVGLGPMGCIPHSISTYDTNGSTCVDNINNAGQLFNDKLKSLVDRFNGDFPDAKFIYINSFGIASVDPTQIGFKVVNTGCCKVIGDGTCIPRLNPCPDRNEYVFWDGFHPTEAANRIVAARSYTAVNPSDAYPFDISHLANM